MKECFPMDILKIQLFGLKIIHAHLMGCSLSGFGLRRECRMTGRKTSYPKETHGVLSIVVRKVQLEVLLLMWFLQEFPTPSRTGSAVCNYVHSTNHRANE
jgi:hypothetical protein